MTFKDFMTCGRPAGNIQHTNKLKKWDGVGGMVARFFFGGGGGGAKPILPTT